jgi:hypothetical protein
MVARLWSEIEPSVTIDTYRERLAAKASKADLKRHVKVFCVAGLLLCLLACDSVSVTCPSVIIALSLCFVRL